MNVPEEVAFYFPGESGQIFGFLHKPGTGSCQEGFVFCYPCFEEKLWVHRVYVNLARELSARGFSVLRFDFRGHGDSDGDFAEASVTTRLADLDRAVARMREELGIGGRISLLGLRFGALLAATYAERHPEIERIVLWDPAMSGSQYMQEVLLSNIATQSAVYGRVRQTREDLMAQLRNGNVVNVEGYELGRAYFEEASSLDLIGPRQYRGKCLIVQIAKNERQPRRKDLEALCRNYHDAGMQIAVEEPFWKEIRAYYPKADNLARVTLEWIENDGR